MVALCWDFWRLGGICSQRLRGLRTESFSWIRKWLAGNTSVLSSVCTHLWERQQQQRIADGPNLPVQHHFLQRRSSSCFGRRTGRTCCSPWPSSSSYSSSTPTGLCEPEISPVNNPAAAKQALQASRGPRYRGISAPSDTEQGFLLAQPLLPPLPVSRTAGSSLIPRERQ